MKTSDGEGTIGILPPYIKTYLEWPISLKELKEKGEKTLYPQVPATYKNE